MADSPPDQPPPAITSSEEVTSAFARVIPAGSLNPNAGRLFGFPYAGTGAAVFASWRDTGFDAVDVYAAMLPGRDGLLRQTPLDSIDVLAERSADGIAEIVATQPGEKRPLILVGCSFGGIVAFETAHRLTQRGITVDALMVAACRPPHAIEVTEPVTDLPDEEMVMKLKIWYGAIPDELIRNPEMLKLLLPAIRGDMRAYETYQYTERTPLDCPLMAVGGGDDKIISNRHLSDWRRHTRGRFTTRTFAGDHFFMRTDPRGALKLIQRRLGL